MAFVFTSIVVEKRKKKKLMDDTFPNLIGKKKKRGPFFLFKARERKRKRRCMEYL